MNREDAEKVVDNLIDRPIRYSENMLILDKYVILKKEYYDQIEGSNMGRSLNKNSEGYPDHTAGAAIREADKPPEKVTACIRRMKTIADWHGMEVCGRIWLRDRETGREYK